MAARLVLAQRRQDVQQWDRQGGNETGCPQHRLPVVPRPTFERMRCPPEPHSGTVADGDRVGAIVQEGAQPLRGNGFRVLAELPQRPFGVSSCGATNTIPIWQSPGGVASRLGLARLVAMP